MREVEMSNPRQAPSISLEETCDSPAKQDCRGEDVSFFVENESMNESAGSVSLDTPTRSTGSGGKEFVTSSKSSPPYQDDFFADECNDNGAADDEDFFAECKENDANEEEDFFADDGTDDPLPNLPVFKTQARKSANKRVSDMRSGMEKLSTIEALQLEADVTQDMDEDEDDEELISSTMDLFKTKLSVRRSIFHVILGISALLDFLSCLSPVLIHHNDVEKDDSPNTRLLYEYLFEKVATGVSKEGTFWAILRWLDQNNDWFGILFSLIWFVYSFRQASRIRMWIWRKRDKERLLKDNHQNGKTMTKSPLREDGKCSEDATSNDFIDWLGGGWGVNVIMVGFQLLLLPVGFYLVSYNAIRAFLHQDSHEEGAAPICVEDTDNSGTYAALSMKTQHSLGTAVFQHLAWLLSQMVKQRTKDQIRSTIMRIGKYLTRFAVRHPMKFRRKLKKALRVLRWAKYLAPLIGTSNKLKGNIQDLLKKYRQRTHHIIFQKCFAKQSIMSSDLSDEEKLQRAPTLIQTRWRSRQKRKAYRAMMMFKGDTEMMAALKMQGMFRDMLQRARARLARKKKELAGLLELERRAMRNRKGAHISLEQRKRMYKLQEELNIAARKRRDTKMLLRPNTRFAVTWKILFVCCLLTEITQLALKPKLDRYVDKKTKEKLDLHDVLHTTLVPKLTTEWDECAFLEPSVIEINPKKSGGRVFSFGRKKKVNVTPPWYCHKPYSTVHNAFVRGLKFALSETLVLISVVCFLDVFVTFFTGEIDPTSGALVPKPFFKRWVLPGIILQLLVNPKMVEVSGVVKAVIRGVNYVGPVHALRWLNALFIPVFTFLARSFENRVWRRFVKEENMKTF